MMNRMSHRLSIRIAVVGFTCFSMAASPLWADSLRAANRNARPSNSSVRTSNINLNRNANANINRNANVNVNHNANVRVNRDVNVNVNRHAHVDVDVDHNHGRFWAGLGAGIIVGAVVASIPPKTQVVVVSGTSYHYVDGVYYVQGSAGYTVVAPPVGAIVGALPPGSMPIIVGPTTYHYYNGTYYVQQGTTFVVVNAPIGITVTVLPVGATQIVVNGTVYYLFGGVHYRPEIQNGMTVYNTAMP